VDALLRQRYRAREGDELLVIRIREIAWRCDAGPIQKQRQPRVPFTPEDTLHVAQVVAVHRQQQVIAFGIVGAQLAGAMRLQVVTRFRCGGAHAWIGLFADMPTASAAGCHVDVETGFGEVLAGHSLGQGRAADVAEADHQNGRNFSLFHIVNCISVACQNKAGVA
jgi:hypothetical protein